MKYQLDDLQVEALIVLDQFDEAFTRFRQQENDLEVLALELQSRANHKNFRVLVVVRDYLSRTRSSAGTATRSYCCVLTVPAATQKALHASSSSRRKR